MPFDSDAPVEVTTRDRLIQLRNFLADLEPHHFDMGNWSCGTAACIGGWAEAKFFGPGTDPLWQEVCARIGLTPEQGEALMFPTVNLDRWDIIRKATPAQAVKVLDHLLATGEVDWDVAFQ